MKNLQYNDSNRFQTLAQNIKLKLEVDENRNGSPSSTALAACRAIDKALLDTIAYIQDRKGGLDSDIQKERRLSTLWLKAAEKVTLLDPNLAAALHFKGMGWTDGSMWDIARSRDMKISVIDMQNARLLLGQKQYQDHVSQKSSNWEKIVIFISGIIFIIVLMIIALTNPSPSEFQYTIFRIILALSAASMAAIIPGFIEVKYKDLVRAGGAIAIFVIVYFFAPAALT